MHGCSYFRPVTNSIRMSNVCYHTYMQDVTDKLHKDLEHELERIEQLRNSMSSKALSFRNSAFARFPFVFILLSSFGLVATFYGFEKFIDHIPLFADHPSLILLTGIATLILTGSLYKKLS